MPEPIIFIDYYDDPSLEPIVRPEGVSTNTVVASPWGPGTSRDAAIYHAQSVNDAGGNKFVAAVYGRGNDVVADIWLIDHNGTVLQEWEVRAHPGPQAVHKWDSFNILISGADLECWGSSHEAISGERDNCIMYARLVGVVPVPYQTGHDPHGGAFDTSVLGGTPDPPPSSGCPSADEVAAAVLAKMTGELGNPNSLIYAVVASLVRNQTHNAISTSGLAHPADIANALATFNYHDGSPAATSLYNRIKETAYESDVNAIHDTKS